MQHFLFEVHPDWKGLLNKAWATMDPSYLAWLNTHDQWLPGARALLAAFRVPMASVRYVLLGESPYPRAASANGYAFWDAGVGSLWSKTGLSVAVNRATSLRHFMKMLLVARGDLSLDLSQNAIAALETSRYVQTAPQLFQGMLQKGFLLLNASLVFTQGRVPYHARQWRPFIHAVLCHLAKSSSVELILLGRIAQVFRDTSLFTGLLAEHPYNISFITQPDVLAFFKPLDLLSPYDQHN